MLNKLQYTFGGKFTVFGYSYPNTGINQSEHVNGSHFIVINIRRRNNEEVLNQAFRDDRVRWKRGFS